MVRSVVHQFTFFGLLAVGCLCLSLPQANAAKAIYRGVATDQWSGGCADIQALSRMSWYYNWGLTPPTNVASCDLGTRYVEYVPMIWGNKSVDTFLANLPSNTQNLLGFNEPNFADQANLYPAEAAVAWKRVIAQLETAGLLGKIRLGTPSASPGGFISPQDWFTWFFGNCTGCHFDFLAFHIYDCNIPYFDTGAFNYWLGQVSGFGLPIWLTEFACPSNGGGVTLANELTFMQNALFSLDNNTQVERYSWFTARATNVGTLPSLLNSAAGSLTQVGTLYNSAGDSLPLPTSTSPSPSPSKALSPSVGSSNAPSPSSQVASPSPSLSGSSSTVASPSPSPSLSGSSPKHEPSPGKSSASGLVHPLALIRSLLFA